MTLEELIELDDNKERVAEFYTTMISDCVQKLRPIINELTNANSAGVRQEKLWLNF